MDRELSDLEKLGWRRSWDGWRICPAHVAEAEAKTGRTWAVPPTYDRPIVSPARCGRLSCGVTA